MEASEPVRDRLQVARRGVVASFLLMAGSGYFELFTGLFRSVLVMRFLGPTGNGLLSAVRLIQQYLSNSHLGVLHGMTKHLPRALGSSDEEQAQTIEDVGTTWILVTSGVGTLAIVVAACLWGHLDLQTRYVLVMGALIFVCGQVYELYRTVGRAWQVFQPLVVASVVFSLGLTVFMVLGSWVASAPGAVYGWLAASVASILVLHIMMHFGARLRLHWPTVRALIISGIPLAAMAFADTLLVSLDGTLLLRRSTTTFGLYSGIAMQTRRYLFNLARSLTFVLMPHMLEAFARVGSPEALRRTSLNAATAASWAVPTFSLITAILLPAATRAVVPKFYAAVPAGQIVAFSAPLMILPLAFSTVLVSLNAEWHSVSAQLLGAGAIAVLGWRTAGEGDMVGMAVASTVGYLTVALGVSWMAMSRLGLGPGRIVRTLLGLLAPVALSPAVFLIAELLTRDLAGWPSDTWAGCGTRMLIALVLTAPTLLLAERRHQMLGRCVRALGRLRRPVGTEGLADAREQP